MRLRTEMNREVEAAMTSRTCKIHIINTNERMQGTFPASSRNQIGKHSEGSVSSVVYNQINEEREVRTAMGGNFMRRIYTFFNSTLNIQHSKLNLALKTQHSKLIKVALMAVLAVILIFGFNTSVMAAGYTTPSGGYQESSNNGTLTVGIYSDQNCTNQITSASTGQTVYICVDTTWGNLTGDKKAEVKVFDYSGSNVNTTVTLSGSNPSWSASYTIPNNNYGQLYFEVNIQDNDGDQAKAGMALDISGQQYYIKLYCDNTYTTECNTFGDNDTIYIEMVSGVNSTPDWGANGKSKNEVDDFWNNKYQWTNFQNHTQNGTTYRYEIPVSTLTGGLSMNQGEWYWLKPKLQSSGGTKIYDKGEIMFLYQNGPTCSATAPTDLTATNVQSTQVDLQWTADCTNNDTYNVYRDGTQIASGIACTAGTMTYTDTTVSANTSYTYTVRGYNNTDACESGDSNAVNVTTPNCTEATPSSIIWNGTNTASGNFNGSSFVTATDIQNLEFKITQTTTGSGGCLATGDYQQSSNTDRLITSVNGTPSMHFNIGDQITIEFHTATRFGDATQALNIKDSQNNNIVNNQPMNEQQQGTEWVYTYTWNTNGASADFYQIEVKDKADNDPKAGVTIVLGNPSVGMYFYSDAGYTNQTDTFADGDTVYVEVRLSGNESTIKKSELNNWYNTKVNTTNNIDQTGKTFRYHFTVNFANAGISNGDWGYVKWQGNTVNDRFERAIYRNDSGCTTTTETVLLDWNPDPQEASGVLVDGQQYNLYARGQDPECGTMYYGDPSVANTTADGVAQQFTWSACTDPDPTTGVTVSPASNSTVNGTVTVSATISGETTPDAGSATVTITGSTACDVTSAAMTWNATSGAWEYTWDTSACGSVNPESGITIQVNYTDPDCGTVTTGTSNNITIDNRCPATAPTDLSGTAASSSQVDLTWTADCTVNDTYNIYRDGTQIASGIACTAGTMTYSDTTVAPNTTYNYTVRGYDNAQACESGDSNTATVTTPNGPVYNITSCTDCHGQPPAEGATRSAGTGQLGGGQVIGSHSIHVTQLGLACTECHVDNGTNLSHRNGVINFVTIRGGSYSPSASETDLSNTGEPLQDIEDGTGLGTCNNTGCHGVQSPTWGTTTNNPTCYKCHGTQANGNNAPSSASDTPSGNANKVGAHQAHLQAIDNYSSPIQCSECHTVPNAPMDAGHLYDGTNDTTLIQAELNFGTLATNNGAPGTYNYSTQTCDVYCHNEQYFKNAWGTGTAPTWNDSTYLNGTQSDCSKCHGDPPGGGHPSVAQNACSQCHNHVNANGNGFIDPTLHVNGKVEGGTCTTCHNGVPTGATYVTRDVVGSDFTQASRHVMGGTVTNWDCIVCHAEGDANQAVNGKVSTDSVLHHNGGTPVVDLRNVDNPTQVVVQWDKNNITPAMEKGLDDFCMTCHDSNGASGIAVASTNDRITLTPTTQEAMAPFNDSDGGYGALNASGPTGHATRPHVVDVYDQFNPGTYTWPAGDGTMPGGFTGTNYNGNASQHAVRGPRYSTTNANWNTWVNRTLKSGQNLATSRETSQLHCADCHTVDQNAHGGANVFMLTAQGTSNTGSAIDKTCTQCHSSNVYLGGTGGRWDHKNEGDVWRSPNLASYWDNSQCLLCHGGGSGDFNGMPEQYGGIHGMNSNDPRSNTPPYRFMGGSYIYPNPGGNGSWNSAATNTTCYGSSSTTKWASCNKHDGSTGSKGWTYNYGRPTTY